MLSSLRRSDPRDAEAKTDLVSNDLALGRIAAALGRWREARDWFGQARASAVALARDDPQNAKLAREVRAIQLFQARAWLMGPPALRPAASVVRQAIGDCAAERSRPNETELADLCALVEARAMAMAGDDKGMRRWLASIPRSGQQGANVLSQLWLMGVGAEERAALAAWRQGD